ncbi:hypothetical protein LCGC14_2153790 [marine sediment metagenome]|uniref:B12-binding domain-containing protein n=1 Tax=marine sediment metagenome TaxID=412755 RepID=A0A0F9DUZ7_9ZZZZ
MDEVEDFLSKIRNTVATLDFFHLRSALREAFNAGIPGYDIIKKGVLEGLANSGEIGLIVAAEALSKEISSAVKEEISKKYLGVVVIGTVHGDIHDLGKNILIALLKSIGINVRDLGIDVSPELFVENAQIEGVKVIALSSLLSISTTNVKKTIIALEKAGLRDNIKIIVGGAAMSRELADDLKADAYAKDALMGLEIVEKWLSVQ